LLHAAGRRNIVLVTTKEQKARHDMLDRVPDAGIFLHTSLLRNLAEGCRDLLQMARNDRFGVFRGSLCDGWPPRYGQEPLLSDDEDRTVRRLGNRVIGLFGGRATQPPEHRPERRLAAA
jgi:hypothetical protein